MERIEGLRGGGIETEAAVYGRLPLMFSAHCPVGAELSGKPGGKPCGLCGGGARFALTDRRGAEFPVVCDRLDCRAAILNVDRLAVPGLARRLMRAGVSMLRLLIHDEPPEEAARLVGLFRGAMDGEATDELTGKGYTKGHYFRGV